MASPRKPTALEEDDPLDAELMSLTADQLAERMKLEAVRALGRILKSPLSKPTDLLRAAEAMLRFEEAESDTKRPISGLTDAELLTLARGSGVHPTVGHDPQPDPRKPLANPVTKNHELAAPSDEHRLSVLLRRPISAPISAPTPKTPEPWE